MRRKKPSQPASKEEYLPQRERQMDRAQLTARRLEGKRKRRSGKRNSSLRAGLAVMAGRTAGALSRRLHIGGGTSIVGVVAQSVYPDIVEHLATQLEHGSVIVTGTNGKTTTSSFIAAILRDGGLRVWNNREGSNLMRGIASSLVIRALPNGHLRRSGSAISILEVDEAALPQVVQAVPPRIVIFTNLFRDQLDRYGEVDSVITHWRRAINQLSPETTLILNADDPAITNLGRGFTGKILYYGIEDPALDPQGQSNERHQVMDTRTCPECGNEYTYDVRFYSHMGHYRCPQCGSERPQPDLRVTQIQLDSFDRWRLQVSTSAEERELIIPLPGFYNIYNALAAIAAAQALGISWEPIITGIEQFKPAFGRGERIQAEGRTIRLLLAKNPTGFNEVLRTLFSEGIPRHVLFVLNDNTADGRDISWIWDVDFERVADQNSTLVASGTRALDMALRLTYAGVAQENLTIVPPAPLRATRGEEANARRLRRLKKRGKAAGATVPEDAPETTRLYGLKNAMKVALEQTPIGETLFIVPTYTGLLEVHHELEQRGLTPRYWEGREV